MNKKRKSNGTVLSVSSFNLYKTRRIVCFRLCSFYSCTKDRATLVNLKSLIHVLGLVKMINIVVLNVAFCV